MRHPWLNLILAPAVLLALIVLPFVLYWSTLPSPMAIHWGLGGEPNGSAPPAVALLILAGLFVAMTVAVRRVLSRTPLEAPSFIAGLYAVGALLVGVSWLSVLANRDAASWSDAGEVGWIELLGLIVLALFAGAIGWVIAGGRSSEPAGPSSPSPTLDVAAPSSAVWSGRGIGKVTTVIAVAILIAAVFTWGWSAILLVVIAVVALMFSIVRTTVSARGVVVSLGWWGFPVWTVPMETISRAEVEVVNPMAYGGWGYRVRPGVRAVVVRSGQSLRLVRNDATDLVYTVDDAETGAGLINAILTERAR
ncbi:MAG: DUF1648 domain-containing protein [Acidimicrobiia bacterium]|nr:DUF1648 domain-containing protein [Acidimicrobiia bacterium]